MSAVGQKLHSLPFIQEVGEALGATAGFQSVLDTLGQTFLRDLEADGYAFLVPCEGGGLKLKASKGIEPIVLDEIVTWLSEQDLKALVSSEAAPIVLPIGAGGPTSQTPRQFFCIPLEHRSRILGVLAVAGRHEGALEAGEDLKAFKAIKAVMSESLANANLIEDLVELTSLIEGILRSMSSGLVAIDVGGRVTYFNAAAEKILGLKARDAVGGSCRDLLRTQGGGEDLLLDALRGRCGEWQLELVGADGRQIPVTLCLSQIVKEDGEVAGALGIFADLTETRTMQESMQRKERLAYLGELSAAVAHEIRNPLAGIGTCAEVLKNRVRDDKEKLKFVSVILEEVSRLDKIISNLLLFAKPAAPRLTRHDLRACVDKAITLVKEEADARGVRIVVHWGDDLPSTYVDPDQMLQVLLNLCRNSLEAMENGGTLEFRSACVERELTRRKQGRRRTDEPPKGEPPARAKFIRLEVRDTGHGIKKENLARLFDPFFTTRSGGTGLGLSISQSIVREHHGDVQITSTEGSGTVATIEIPVEKRYGERRRRS